MPTPDRGNLYHINRRRDHSCCLSIKVFMPTPDDGIIHDADRWRYHSCGIISTSTDEEIIHASLNIGIHFAARWRYHPSYQLTKGSSMLPIDVGIHAVPRRWRHSCSDDEILHAAHRRKPSDVDLMPSDDVGIIHVAARWSIILSFCRPMTVSFITLTDEDIIYAAHRRRYSCGPSMMASFMLRREDHPCCPST